MRRLSKTVLQLILSAAGWKGRLVTPGPVVGSAVLLLFSLLGATVGCINVDLYSGFRQNDFRAQSQLHKLNQAEAAFFALHSKFGDLLELGPNGIGLIDADLAHGTSDGYQFKIEVKVGGYHLFARPTKYLKTGWRSYYTDETQVIRQSVDDAPATAISPELIVGQVQQSPRTDPSLPRAKPAAVR
jgi:hypothetical protein